MKTSTRIEWLIFRRIRQIIIADNATETAPVTEIILRNETDKKRKMENGIRLDKRYDFF